MSKHTYFECKGCERGCQFCDGGCQFCDGGLAGCKVCGGFEGSLTTDCCGRQITEDEERRIYNEGALDFRAGQWVNEPNYPRSGQKEGTCG